MTKVALITGCSSGFGYEAAKLLAENGYIVYAGMHHEKDLGVLPNAVWLDVTWNEEKIKEVVKKIGKIDILVNNAGFAFLGPVADFSEKGLQEQFAVNVFGLIKVTNAVLPGMRKNKSGRIVNISSNAGIFSGPAYGIYCASKHAVEAITQALRAEEAANGIQVSAINPGSFATKFWEHVKFAGEGKALKNLIARVSNNIHRLRGRTDPKAVARKIKHVIESNNPKKNYPVGLDSYGLFFVRQWVPFFITDIVTKRVARSLTPRNT